MIKTTIMILPINKYTPNIFFMKIKIFLNQRYLDFIISIGTLYKG